MKKIFFVITLQVFSVCSFCQQKDVASVFTKEDYLKKSKNQNTVSYVVGIPGVLMLLTGGIMYMSEFRNGLPGSITFNESRFKTGEVLMVAGGGLVLASVPFIIAAGKNKNLAMSIAIKDQKLQQLTKTGFASKAFHSLTLNISL